MNRIWIVIALPIAAIEATLSKVSSLVDIWIEAMTAPPRVEAQAAFRQAERRVLSAPPALAAPLLGHVALEEFPGCCDLGSWRQATERSLSPDWLPKAFGNLEAVSL